MTVEQLKAHVLRGQDDLDLNARPDTIGRRCTDASHALIFVLFCAGWVACVLHVLQRGDMGQLDSFQDGNGNRCNYNGQTPYLFFCKNRSGGLSFDLERPICREACPNATSVSIDTVAAKLCGSPDYTAIPQMRMVCEVGTEALPADDYQARALNSFVEMAKTTILVRIVVDRWQTLLVCSLIAVMASYGMLWILENNAGCLVRLGLIVLTAATALCAAYLFEAFAIVGLTPVPRPMNDVAASILVLASLVSFCIMTSMSSSVETATDCIELACRCVMKTPSLSMHPLCMFACHFCINVITGCAVLMLLSLGRTELVNGEAGFSLSTPRLLCLLYLVIMWFWLHQSIYAMSAFVTSYAAVVWYQHRGDMAAMPRFLLCRAYWVAVRYHFGTITLGGLVVAVSQPLRMTMGLLVSWTSLKGNCITRGIRGSCCCLGDIAEAVHPLRMNAFIDVAISGRPFYAAAHCIEAITQLEGDAMKLLTGATWIFQIVGLSVIGGLGALVMLYQSSQVIQDTYAVVLGMSGAGAIISVSTAMPFALIFDTVADAIFYCSELENLQRRRSGTTALRGLTERACPCLSKDAPLSYAFSSVWQTLAGADEDEDEEQGFIDGGDNAAWQKQTGAQYAKESAPFLDSREGAAGECRLGKGKGRGKGRS